MLMLPIGCENTVEHQSIDPKVGTHSRSHFGPKYSSEFKNKTQKFWELPNHQRGNYYLEFDQFKGPLKGLGVPFTFTDL